MQIEKTVVGLAWTSPGFLTQERGLSVRAVRSLCAHQHPPLAHERGKREVIQFAPGAPQAARGTAWSPLLPVPASPPLCLPACRSRPPGFVSAAGEMPALHFVLQNVESNAGRWSTPKENQIAPPQPSFPAGLPGRREQHQHRQPVT